MAPPKTPRVFEREAAPWSLTQSITKKICRLAGREASAALHIALALGKHSLAPVALESVFHEPFAYGDWHGVGPDDTDARDRKRQRVWEHQRGFIVNGTISCGYPTSRERWESFKQEIGKDGRRKRWVKRIAVANWMEAMDLTWIAENLPALEGIDLSDTPAESGRTTTDWATMLEPKMPKKGAVSKLIPKLLWLGIPDFRVSADKMASTLINDIVPRCTSLRTLSIREKDFGNAGRGTVIESHRYACVLPYMVAHRSPKSVTRLELRMYYPLLDRLMSTLTATKSSIRYIGIDFGAWVQESHYPGSEKFGHDEEEVMDAGKIAAQKDRFEAYEQSHNEVFAPGSKWWLPPSALHCEPPEDSTGNRGEGGSRGIIHETSFDGPAHSYERDFFGTNARSKMSTPNEYSIVYNEKARCDKGSDRDHKGLFEYIKRAKVGTLPVMLNRLQEAAAASPRIRLFALEPEWQKRSTDPVHPFALLQRNGSLEKSVNGSVRPGVYAWLQRTFLWRPVFDWDWFVKPGNDNAELNLPSPYRSLREEWGLKSAKSAQLDDGELVGELAKQFLQLRDGGIPVHLLIGRRHPDDTSLYWGWPYEPAAWSKWLQTPFDANLKLIAPLVDTLTVSYDLRNPLDEDHLEDIDDLQDDYKAKGHATCPRPLCPWRSAGHVCPFKQQWPHMKPDATNQAQKMANGKKIMPVDKYPLKLASQLLSNPPPGEYAQDWRPDDEDTDDDETDTPLHECARHAAFKREAVGWQRFWNEYAPRLTHLSELRVRMPHSFDRVSSVRLAKLLVPENQWRMVSYANERQHMQTAADISDSFSTDGRFNCTPEEKIWPAGRFVRRTWLRVLPKKIPVPLKALYKGMNDAEAPSAGSPSAAEEPDIDTREHAELRKAIDRAGVAATVEQDRVSQLKAKQVYFPPTHAPTPDPDNQQVEALLTGLYGRRIRRTAKTTWRRQLRAYISELAPEVDKAATGPVKDVLHRTHERMQARARGKFRAADAFMRYAGGKGVLANDVAFRQHRVKYTREDERRRKWPERVDFPAGDGRGNDDLYDAPTPPQGSGLRDVANDEVTQTNQVQDANARASQALDVEEAVGVGRATQVTSGDTAIIQESVQVEHHTEIWKPLPGLAVQVQETVTSSVVETADVEQVQTDEEIDEELFGVDDAVVETTEAAEEVETVGIVEPQVEDTPPPKPPVKKAQPAKAPPSKKAAEKLKEPSPPPKKPSSPPQPQPTPASKPPPQQSSPPQPPPPASPPAPRKRKRIDPVLDSSLAGYVAPDLTATRTRRSATPLSFKVDEGGSDSGTDGGRGRKKRKVGGSRNR